MYFNNLYINLFKFIKYQYNNNITYNIITYNITNNLYIVILIVHYIIYFSVTENF